MKKLTTNEEVQGLLHASSAAAAFRATITTGLLWMLAEKPMNGEEVSKALNIPGKRGHYWLQYLQSFGILESVPQGYIPSAVVRSAILESTFSREGWEHLVTEEQQKDRCLHGFPQLISESGSLWTLQGLEKPQYYVEQMKASPGRAREFTRMLFNVHQDLARQVAALLDLTGIQSMMNLGGGSGVMSMAFLRRYPDLTSTIVDLENVCIAGREIAEEMALSDRISYYPADLDCDDFPSSFDLIFQCDVNMYGARFVKKLARSLKSGGRYIVVNHFSLAENFAPTTVPQLTFVHSLHDPDFCFPTLKEFKRLLVDTGFVVSDEHPTLGRGWVVIQAQKTKES